MAGLKAAFNTLKDVVEDLTSLQVQTFSGTIDIRIEKTGFRTLREAIEAKRHADIEGDRISRNEDTNAVTVKEADGEGSVTVKGDIEVVATSYIQFDGDSYNFIATGASDKLVKAHNDAVAAGMESRKALLALLLDIVGLD
jgi:hypothetical protein